MSNNEFIDSVSNRFRYESFSNLANEISKCSSLEEMEDALKQNVKYIVSSYQFLLCIYIEDEYIQFNQKTNTEVSSNCRERIFNNSFSKPLIAHRKDEIKGDKLINNLFQNSKVKSVLRVNNQLETHGFLAYVTAKEDNSYTISDIKFLKLICEIVLSKTQSILLSNRLLKQNEELKNANDIINTKNNTIQSSIKYAALIQQALLQSENSIKQAFEKFFIFHKPKDMVGGDFYFSYSRNEYSLLVVADCTGHGVPGAILSIFGIQLLREYCNNSLDLSPDKILKSLDLSFEQHLSGASEGSEAPLLQDGMDASIILVNNETNTIAFSSAYGALQLYNATDERLITVKGNRVPIGNNTIYRDKNFTKHIIDFNKGDRIYLYSDGYKDQFGGPNNEKFKINRFKNLIKDCGSIPIPKQKEVFISEFEKWKGNSFQLDDVLVIGLEM